MVNISFSMPNHRDPGGQQFGNRAAAEWSIFILAKTARLLAVKRGHWTIENQVHYVKDVSLGEDASAIRADHGPHVMALLRDSVLNLIRLGGHRSVAAALRHYSRNPQAVLALVGVLRSENA